jgi:tripartite ATP-independent transporter DctM subunit
MRSTTRNLVIQRGKCSRSTPGSWADISGVAWTARADRAIGAVVEPVAAALVAVELILMMAAVIARYVLHSALAWSDELALILFLWLTMLGAVVAYRNGEHMRLTTFLRRASPGLRETLDILSATGVAVFCIGLLPACWSYFNEGRFEVSAALQMPRAYAYAAMFAGLALIAALAVLRLIEADRKRVAIVLAATAVAIAAGFALHPALASLGNVNLLIFFVFGLGVAVVIGMPIVFCFGLATLAYVAFTTSVPLNAIVSRMDQGISNFVLLTVPLFILLGALVDATGIARRLIDAIASLVGHLRGGLSIVLVVAMYLVSGISGSKTADMAAVAPALFPEMERRGSNRDEMIALLATSGAMAETIPPSLVLIVIGTVVGLSIADLFTAGLLPATVAAIALIAVALLRSRGDRTELAPRPSGRTIVRAFAIAIPGLLLPFVIRFFVVAGITTATEVSAIGVVYALIVGTLVYREFDWRRAYPILRDTAALNSVVTFIIGTAMAMGWALTQSGFSQQLADALAGAPGGRAGFLALSIVLFIVLGSVLEGVPAIVLFGPLLFPIAHTFGINPIHFAIVVVLAMGIGLFSPPFGVGYYGACAIGKADPDEAARRIAPYLLALVAALIVIAAVPWISLGFLKT